jgi:hypothetical protein
MFSFSQRRTAASVSRTVPRKRLAEKTLHELEDRIWASAPIHLDQREAALSG